jgi:hypothetical protein
VVAALVLRVDQRRPARQAARRYAAWESGSVPARGGDMHASRVR